MWCDTLADKPINYLKNNWKRNHNRNIYIYENFAYTPEPIFYLQPFDFIVGAFINFSEITFTFNRISGALFHNSFLELSIYCSRKKYIWIFVGYMSFNNLQKKKKIIWVKIKKKKSFFSVRRWIFINRKTLTRFIAIALERTLTIHTFPNYYEGKLNGKQWTGWVNNNHKLSMWKCVFGSRIARSTI